MPFSKKYKPAVKRKVDRLASKAPRDKATCQGEIVSKKAAINPILLFFVNIFVNKYVNTTAITPNKADGNRIANSFKPNTAIEGIAT